MTCFLIHITFSGINRNILECKDISQNREVIVKSVLIETYWNVKVEYNKMIMRTMRCINRNILECKGSSLSTRTTSRQSINRNILECKEMTSQKLNISRSVLIETYWNVKCHSRVHNC